MEMIVALLVGATLGALAMALAGAGDDGER